MQLFEDSRAAGRWAGSGTQVILLDDVVVGEVAGGLALTVLEGFIGARRKHKIAVGRARYYDVAKGDAMQETDGFAKAILEAAGSGLDKILKTTIYIPDMSYWAEINRIYAECMGDHKPARAVVPCGDLHYGVLLEMEVVAAI